MHTIGLALAAVTAITLGFAATSVLGDGPLDGVLGVGNAIDQIEENMKACAQETSGVLDVLMGVVGMLEGLPDDVAPPEPAPEVADGELPPCAQAELPDEPDLPDEADEALGREF